MPANGSLDYIELATPNMEASKRFYGSVFGWTFTEYGPDYAEFDSFGRKGGFSAARKVVASGGPLLVLWADDLDAMEANVVQAGAEITEHHVFPGGRRFHFRDPNGNEIAIWTKTD